MRISKNLSIIAYIWNYIIQPRAPANVMYMYLQMKIFNNAIQGFIQDF